MPIEFECTACQRRVKAPDSLAGKKARCPTCQAVLDVPDAVIEAEEMPAAYTAAPAQAPAIGFNQPQIEPETGQESRRPCPMCGELIVTSAVKCRFCGEIFDPTLRRKSTSKDDDEMNAMEWAVAILPCFNIGCILGIVYMVQGKSKGLKMLLISIGFQIFWGVVITIIGELGKR